jgi:hypothetical protein
LQKLQEKEKIKTTPRRNRSKNNKETLSRGASNKKTLRKKKDVKTSQKRNKEDVESKEIGG